jgi:hypothetical protein
MLDLIGTTVLTAVIALQLNAAIITMPLSLAQKLMTVVVAGLWIGFAIALGSTGIYESPAPPPAIGVVAASSVIVIAAAALLLTGAREALLAIPLPLLIGLNIARIAPGAFMVLLGWQGRLSGPFPHLAGWGDIIAGATAIPLSLAVARNFYDNRGAVLAWNIFGLLDLVTAMVLGVLSTPASPLQIFGGTVGATAIAQLPWSNIPTLIVPFYLVVHGIIFVRLAGAAERPAS